MKKISPTGKADAESKRPFSISPIIKFGNLCGILPFKIDPVKGVYKPFWMKVTFWIHLAALIFTASIYITSLFSRSHEWSADMVGLVYLLSEFTYYLYLFKILSMFSSYGPKVYQLAKLLEYVELSIPPTYFRKTNYLPLSFIFILALVLGFVDWLFLSAIMLWYFLKKDGPTIYEAIFLDSPARAIPFLKNAFSIYPILKYIIHPIMTLGEMRNFILVWCMDAIIISTAFLIVRQFNSVENFWKTEISTNDVDQHKSQQKIIHLHLSSIECIRVFNQIFSSCLFYDFASTLPYVCSQLGAIIGAGEDLHHYGDFLPTVASHFSWVTYIIRILCVIWVVGSMSDKAYGIIFWLEGQMNSEPGLDINSRSIALMNIMYGNYAVSATIGEYMAISKMTMITVVSIVCTYAYVLLQHKVMQTTGTPANGLNCTLTV